LASISVLLDTNLLIGREDPKALETDYQTLLQLLNSNGVRYLVHPLSIRELEGDRDRARREMVLSKARSYEILDHPPVSSTAFRETAGSIANDHDKVDVELLYAVASNAAGFLLTEDQDLVQRAVRCNLSDRVFTVTSAQEYFSTVFGRSLPAVPAFVEFGPVYNLNLEDPFFDTLKKDYEEFPTWFQKISLERRKCLAVTDSSRQLAALMILKEEDGTVDGLLPSKLRLKISTLKVDPRYSGIRLGELLLAFGLSYCVRNRIGECYLTAFPSHEDVLGLTSVFGFRDIGPNGRGERILLKSLQLEASLGAPTLFERDRLAFPRFHDGPAIRKFLVPVQPPYHSLLFPEYRIDRRQQTLDAYMGPALPAGNAIRKAYISRSSTSLVRPGDVLLFYRSEDAHAVTHAGVVETTKRSSDPVSLLEFVGNRTVLPIEKIREMCDREAIAILFWSVGQVDDSSSGVTLGDLGVPHPQTISQLDEEKYQELKGRWHLN
jgi:predicted nucleic acid-binding protein